MKCVIPKGNYYSCLDAENLEHENPEDALEEYFERFCEDPKINVENCIKQHCPVILNAYVRETVSGEYIKQQAEYLLECLSENFSENYGPQDDEPSDIDGLIAARPIIIQAIKAYIIKSTVWSCRVSGSVEISSEDAIEIMHRWRRDWFHEEKCPSKDGIEFPCTCEEIKNVNLKKENDKKSIHRFTLP